MSTNLKSPRRTVRSLCLALLCWCVTPTTAQLTECYHEGYNLTALTGADLFYTSNHTVWAIHPCGVVVDPWFCLDTFFGGAVGEWCRGNTTISIANPSDTFFFPPIDRDALWAQVDVDGQYGVAKFIQDGSYCLDIAADRAASIVYLCNATATTPYISSITQPTRCHYQAVIQTAVVCAQVPASSLSTAVGTSRVSAECGGGIYDLSGLSASDLLSPPVPGSNYTYVVRVCGSASSTDCSDGASVCQIDHTAPGLNWTLAVWEPAVSPVIWQYLGSGSVAAILQDGTSCDVTIAQNRLTNITFVCDTGAATPVIVSTVENPQCSYDIVVQTDVVCGAAFQLSPPTSSSSSSSSSSSPPTSSSSTAAARVIGDPQFMGLRGQSFQVHGIDGAVYNLIIDHGMIVNARFRYLSSGRCPAVPEPSNCWSHPGSYLGEVGIVSGEGAKLHVVSGGWDAGFGSVFLDSAVLSVGANMSTGGMDVWVLSAYSLRVRVGNFELLLDNSDHFVNLVETRALQWSMLASHGLLGQTWRTPKQAGRQIRHIEGEVNDYVEQSNDLFGSALMYGVGETDE